MVAIFSCSETPPPVFLLFEDPDERLPKEDEPYCGVESLNRCSGLSCRPSSTRPSNRKEDMNVIPTLGRSCRVYLGQGIPDPWMSYPLGYDSLGGLKTEIKKYVLELLRDKNSKDHDEEEPCLSCKKKFLFECPDKRGRRNPNCTCQGCHGEDNTGECDENCKCILVMKNWICEKFLSKEDADEKKRSTRDSRCGSDGETCRMGSNSRNTTKSPNEEEGSRREWASDSGNNRNSSENTEDKPPRKYPLFRNKSSKKKTSQLSSRDVRRVSKQVQADIPFDRISEEVQPEPDRVLPKCTCDGAYVRCRPEKCKPPDTCFNPQVYNLHCPHPSAQSHVCPHYFINPYMVQKLHRHDCPKTVKEDASISSRDPRSTYYINQHHWSMKAKDRSTEELLRNKYSSLNKHERIFYWQPSPTDFNHLKRLTESKLKNYIHRKEFPMRSTNNKFIYHSKPYTSSGFKSFCEGETTPDTLDLKRCKPLYGDCEKKQSSSGLKKDQYGLHKERFNAASQEPKKENTAKLKFFKEILESDESSTYGLIRNREPGKSVRKRKRLIASRKTKRKLVKKNSVFSQKPVQETAEERKTEPHPKKVFFDCAKPDQRSARMISFCRKNDLAFLGARENLSPKQYSTAVANTMKRIEEELSSKKFGFKQPPGLDCILGRISNGSGTPWSATTLKCNADDFVVEKRPVKVRERNAQEPQTHK